jgi:hypothetical protein
LVELQRTLLLAIDDLPVVVREFLKPDIVLSTTPRPLARHTVSNLKALVHESEDNAKPKNTFKASVPGYAHIDIRHLPVMTDGDARTYLFVDIERASPALYVERHRAESQAAPLSLLKRIHKNAPLVIHTLLTDDDRPFTNHFNETDRQHSGEDEFDRLCASPSIEHHITPARRPQTNTQVERVKEPINKRLRTTHSCNGANLGSMIWQYQRVYNRHIRQRTLDHQTRIQTLKT